MKIGPAALINVGVESAVKSEAETKDFWLHDREKTETFGFQDHETKTGVPTQKIERSW